MDVRVEPSRRMIAKELMLLNCAAREDSRVPWNARRSNQSILKEISPEYSLEGLIWSSNIFATWCEEPTHWKRPWWWERLKAGGEGNDRGQDGFMASPTQWTWVEQAPGDDEGQGAWCAAVHGVAKSRIRLSDWTTIEVSFFKHLTSWKDFPFLMELGHLLKIVSVWTWLLLHWSICLSLRSYSCLDFFSPDLPSFPHASSPKRTLLINWLANIPITGSIFRELDLRLQQTCRLIVKWDTSRC